MDHCPRFARLLLAATVIAAGAFVTANIASAESTAASPDQMLPASSNLARSARAVVKAAETFPAPTANGARFFRQTVHANCNLPEPEAAGYCRFQPIAVRANRLLEIENISCISTPGGSVFLLATSSRFAEMLASTVAVLPPSSSNTAGAATVRGPFYFNGGERFFIWATGAPGRVSLVSVCTVYGKLYVTG